jgi:hypothetical protein
MRNGISVTVRPSDRRRLAALARDRNAPHKHVWRAEIVLLSAAGVGTNEIMRKSFTWTADLDKIIAEPEARQQGNRKR